MKQATMTAGDYLLDAQTRIDGQYGEQFSEKNPALVGAFIQTAAINFGLAVLAQQIRCGLDSIASSIEERASLDLSLMGLTEALNLIGEGVAGGPVGSPADSIPDALRSAAHILAEQIELSRK